MQNTWQLVAAVGLGGAVGAVLRYLLTLFVVGYWGNSFPFGTLCVNVVGSLLLGLFLGWSQIHGTETAFKVFITIGLCGALTTFSTFAFDTLSLIQAQQLGRALLNIGLNTTLCLLMVFGGQQLIILGYK
jgi:CrcB protein